MRLEDLPTNDDWSDYDWRQVFRGEVADEWSYSRSDNYSGTFRAGDLTGERIEDVTPGRIAEVVQWHAESPEGYGSVDFWALVKLTDGQYAVCEAWADTTGWGCRADAWWKAGTYEQCVAELSEQNRRQLEARP